LIEAELPGVAGGFVVIIVVVDVAVVVDVIIIIVVGVGTARWTILGIQKFMVGHEVSVGSENLALG
jgi:hypothetical protein